MKRVLADELPDGEHTVVLTHKGTGYNAELDMFTMNIESVRANGLTKSLNSLFREFLEPRIGSTFPSFTTPQALLLTPLNLNVGILGLSLGLRPSSSMARPWSVLETAPIKANEYAIDYTTGTIRMARACDGCAGHLPNGATLLNPTTGIAAITRPSPGSPNYPGTTTREEPGSTSPLISRLGVPNYREGSEIGLFDFSDNIVISKMFSIVRPGRPSKSRYRASDHLGNPTSD